MLRQIRNRNLEAGLDGSHHLLVGLRRDEGDSETLGSETTSATIRNTLLEKRSSVVERSVARTRHDGGSCQRRQGSRS